MYCLCLSIVIFTMEWHQASCGCCPASVWPSFSVSTIFLLCICNTNCSMIVDVPGRFASTRAAFAVKLLLLQLQTPLVYSTVNTLASLTLIPSSFPRANQDLYFLSYFRSNLKPTEPAKSSITSTEPEARLNSTTTTLMTNEEHIRRIKSEVRSSETSSVDDDRLSATGAKTTRLRLTFLEQQGNMFHWCITYESLTLCHKMCPLLGGNVCHSCVAC